MIFISYYTKNTPYEEVMNTHLLPSLMKFKLSHTIRDIETKGTWLANTAYKAEFILQMLEKYKNSVIFLDADATIERHPKLFFEIPNEYDVACHYLDWYKFWKNIEGQSKRDLLSGTMLFRYNEKVIELVKKWIEACKKNPNQWEQKILQQILEKDKTLKVYNLPIEYCAIKKENGDLIDNAIIVHHQVSRLYKNK